MATGKVSITSDAKRKKWLGLGLRDKNSLSFWEAFIGSADAVVHRVKNPDAKDGHTVVFQDTGNLAVQGIKGRNQAYGKGEQKLVFTDKLTVERIRLVVDNGDTFDGVDIGDLNINAHSDSRDKLAKSYNRFKDQFLFDTAQGLNGQSPTHIINLNTTFGYESLLDIEKTIKTSQGFSTGGIRRPLEAYNTADGRPYWLFVMDSAMANMLKKDTKYHNLLVNADVRGSANMAIRGVFGRIGQLLLVEAENAFGTVQTSGNIGLDDFKAEIAGLRQKDASNVWTGQPGFSYSGALYSRGLLLGANAIKLAYGKEPDYSLQKSPDFGITSESMMEFWVGVKKTKLKAGNKDYKEAKISDIDYGVIAVDVKVKS